MRAFCKARWSLVTEVCATPYLCEDDGAWADGSAIGCGAVAIGDERIEALPPG